MALRGHVNACCGRSLRQEVSGLHFVQDFLRKQKIKELLRCRCHQKRRTRMQPLSTKSGLNSCRKCKHIVWGNIRTWHKHPTIPQGILHNLQRSRSSVWSWRCMPCRFPSVLIWYLLICVFKPFFASAVMFAKTIFCSCLTNALHWVSTKIGNKCGTYSTCTPQINSPRLANLRCWIGCGRL